MALYGGDIYVFHARVIRDDVRRYGVRLAIHIPGKDVEKLRKLLKEYYNAKEIYLSYEVENNIHGC